MGLPALRHETPLRATGPKLALVAEQRATRGRARPSSHPKVCHSARCQDAFKTFVAVALLFSCLGIARVALASRAAAVSIESGKMRAKVKEARFEGDSLKIKISQLATPSRIRAIAGKKMKMAPAAGVWYLTIDGSAKQNSAGPAPDPPGRGRPLAENKRKAGASILTSIMHTAAGEAQVLLLGDVGLSSSR